jgi:hypothetical protein
LIDRARLARRVDLREVAIDVDGVFDFDDIGI